LCPQKDLKPQGLAAQLLAFDRARLMAYAIQSKKQEKLGAAQAMAAECENLLL
jgi:hypothetical protein